MNHLKMPPDRGGADPVAAPRIDVRETRRTGPTDALAATAIDEPWLVVPEVASRLLAVSRTTVYMMLAEGTLPSVKIGRCRRIPVEALRAWLAEQTG